MIDPIGIKTASLGDRRLVRIDAAKVDATPAVRPVKPQTAATELSSTMAASAPVDAERVSRIKKAIEDGRFPTVPATIADRLLALKMEWNPHDKA